MYFQKFYSTFVQQWKMSEKNKKLEENRSETVDSNGRF